ncbi:MAG: 30S ribosome-binding factor RbfA [Bacteroidia bacterium]
MSETNVQKKVGRLVQEEISMILSSTLNYFKGSFLTVSGVDMTGDLSIAKVHVSILPDSKLQEAVDTLNENSWEVRKELSRKIKNKLKKMPELRFYGDDSFQKIERLEEIL